MIFTRTPVGRGGKAQTLKGILHPEISLRRAVPVDDRLETIREVADLGLCGVHIQVRKKERPAEWETRQRFWADRHLRGTAQVVEEIIRGDFVE